MQTLGIVKMQIVWHYIFIMATSKIRLLAKSKIVLLIAFLAALPIFIAFFLRTDIENILNQTQTITRCGRIYMIGRVVIEGVNIVDRLNTINHVNQIGCTEFVLGTRLGIAVHHDPGQDIYDFIIYDKKDPGRVHFPIYMTYDDYRINIKENAIYEFSGFDGSQRFIGSFR